MASPSFLYKCFICVEVFPDSTLLQKHADIHMEESNQCCLWGRALSSSAALSRHMLVHAGDNNYLCSVCGKQCVTSTHLKTHMVRHNTKRPYKCSQCHKAYILKAHLARHVMTHTRNKPYKCVHCKQARCFNSVDLEQNVEASLSQTQQQLLLLVGSEAKGNIQMQLLHKLMPVS